MAYDKIAVGKILLNRRHLGAGLLAAAVAPDFGFVGRVLAGEPAAAIATASEAWAELDQLTKAAEALGLAVPRMSLGAETTTDDYNSIAFSIIDLMDGLQSSKEDAIATAKPEDVELLMSRASDLLRELRDGERSPREPEEGEDDARAFAGASIVPPDLDEIAAGYKALFASCKIRDEKRTEVMEYVNRMLDPKRRKQYEQVSAQSCIPWYFVGAIHALEASFDFNAHLHNGDSLKSRTHQIPANRPPKWNPPTDWAYSALDALGMKGYDKEQKWGLAECMYRWERYNGWRSRLLHNINSPYLWSYSNHYSKGKFTRDNYWDENAVSKQPGCGVLLKAMVEMGAVKEPG